MKSAQLPKPEFKEEMDLNERQIKEEPEPIMKLYNNCTHCIIVAHKLHNEVFERDNLYLSSAGKQNLKKLKLGRYRRNGRCKD